MVSVFKSASGGVQARRQGNLVNSAVAGARHVMGKIDFNEPKATSNFPCIMLQPPTCTGHCARNTGSPLLTEEHCWHIQNQPGYMRALSRAQWPLDHYNAFTAGHTDINQSAFSTLVQLENTEALGSITSVPLQLI